MMTRASLKVRPEHLERWAYVYVRQSSLAQVHDHQESTRRQYELHQHARQLGWPDERIVVVDQDLAQSASQADQVRQGFEHLLAEVVVGRVGAIFSLEISRLSRQDSQGHRLVEVATLTGTLLIDEEQVYDPRLADDRLLLGLKVLLSSNELRLMGQRLWENKLRKAHRGELRLNLPIGLVFDPLEGVGLDPNERVQEAVRLLFERFALSGKISHVVRYFHEQGLEYPKRQGGWDGPLEWGRLSCERVRSALDNPRYAGAYVYGQVTQRAIAKPLDKRQQRAVRLPPQEWAVTIWDAFPAYISQADYEANQAILDRNRRRSPGGPARRRDGPALLTGIVLCGRCGQPMQVVYSGKDNQTITYVCSFRQRRYAEPVCQRVPGRPVDQAVAQAVLAALTPAQVDLTLALIAEMERQQAQLKKQWHLKLQDARYAVRLAQRRYEQVDPDNRLVAANLERYWEAALRHVEDIEAETAHQSAHWPPFNDALRQQMANLVQDLPTVWHAQTTSWSDRKDLLQLLLADVTLTRQEADILLHLRWHTNHLDTFTVPLPARGAPPVSDAIVARIRLLSQTHTDRQIAAQLNQDGLHSSQAKPFTPQLVQGIRRRYHIRKRSPHSVHL
jgi:DNA invertase Pin-like site-specific DNA recombinase